MPNIAYYNDCFPAMNTRFEAVFWGIKSDTARRIFTEIEKSVRNTDSLLSCYNPDSEVSQLNAAPSGQPITASEELFKIITLCEEMHRKTLGCFDAALKTLSTFWKDRSLSESEKSDKSQNTRTAAGHDRSGFSKIILDKSDKTVTFKNDATAFDFGGIGKGIALQKIAVILDRSELEHAFISFGESSILCRGHHPHGPFWPFGINHPFIPGDALHWLELTDHSVSVSGTTQRINNEQHFHIIDPVSGNPIRKQEIICVKSESPVIAEILSTAMLVADEKTGKQIISNFKDVEIININYANDEIRVATMTY